MTMKPQLAVSPEPGLASCLWGNPPLSRREHAGVVDMQSLGLSDTLVTDLRVWLAAWKENYVGRNEVGGMLVPSWQDGFDSAEWRSQGVSLIHRLQNERPDLNVMNGFDMYAYPTDPVTHKPQSD